MKANAVQAEIESSEATRRIVAGALARGGAAIAPARLALVPLGPCNLALSWSPIAGGVVISYTLPNGCEHLEELAESELDRILDARPMVGGASWQLSALVALLVLGAAVFVWGRP